MSDFVPCILLRELPDYNPENNPKSGYRAGLTV